MENERTVSTTLNQENLERFELVKKESGLIKDSEVLRFLIAKEFARRNEKDTGEVTISLSKDVMEALESVNYFGWTPEEFFEAAVRAHIGSTACHWPFQKEQEFFKKWGKDISSYTLPDSFDS